LIGGTLLAGEPKLLLWALLQECQWLPSQMLFRDKWTVTVIHNVLVLASYEYDISQ
jgi:hypothetical protein